LYQNPLPLILWGLPILEPAKDTTGNPPHHIKPGFPNKWPGSSVNSPQFPVNLRSRISRHMLCAHKPIASPAKVAILSGTTAQGFFP
jgi:hypothetical protein